MKWYNTDGTKMINTDSVDGYVFIKSGSLDTEPYDIIELIVSGTPYVFKKEEATEIYKLLNRL